MLFLPWVWPVLGRQLRGPVYWQLVVTTCEPFFAELGLNHPSSMEPLWYFGKASEIGFTRFYRRKTAFCLFLCKGTGYWWESGWWMLPFIAAILWMTNRVGETTASNSHEKCLLHFIFPCLWPSFLQHHHLQPHHNLFLFLLFHAIFFIELWYIKTHNVHK